MIFEETRVQGAFEISLDRKADERGFFARSWCEAEFKRQNLNTRLVQCNISFNAQKGTLRGMHFQADPHPEAKLIRCTQGAIYDVVLDLRPDSHTFRWWTAAILSAENRRMLYVP